MTNNNLFNLQIDKIKQLISTNRFFDALSLIAELLRISTKDTIAILKVREFLVCKQFNLNSSMFIQYLRKQSVSNTRFMEYINEVELLNTIFQKKIMLDSDVKKYKKSIFFFYQFLDIQYRNVYRSAIKSNPANLDFFTEKMFDYVKFLYVNGSFEDLSLFKLIFPPQNYQKNFKINEGYMSFLAYWSNFEVCFDLWKTGYYKFYSSQDKIYGKVMNHNEVTKIFLLSNTNANENRKIAIKYRQKNYMKTNLLVQNRHIFHDERIISNYLFDLFYLKSDVVISGVKLSDWIRAYYIVFQVSRITNILHSIFFLMFPKNVLIRSKIWWIRLFRLFQIPKKSASILFSLMEYNIDSTDFYDFPFIKIANNKYLLNTCAYRFAQVEFALESRLNLNGAEPRISGINFENRVIDLLEFHSVQAKGLAQKKNIQCDVAFIIERDIYLCECKYRGRYRKNSLILDIDTKDINQINRIYDYYLNHKDILLKEFNVSKIDNIYKIVIYKQLLFESKTYENVIFMDYKMLFSFFKSREKSGISSYIFKKYIREYTLKTSQYPKVDFTVLDFDQEQINLVLERPKFSF